MIDSARPDSFEMSDYVGVLRRRWRMILTFTFLGTLAAAAYIVVAPKAYTATASVYVTTNAANTAQQLGNKTNTLVNMDNEVQIVLSTSVSKLASKDLHSSLTPTALAKHVSVVVPPNTQVLQISCSDRSPKGAAACAQAFALSYLQAREATARSKIQSELQTELAKEKVLQARSLKLQTQIASLKTGTAASTAAHAALVDVSTQLTPLRGIIASLDASTNYKSGYIVTAALRPTTPSSPRKLLYGPSGLMVGLLAGLILAFWADRRDDRIHAAQDVERFLDIPVLFTVTQRTPGMQNTLVPARSATGVAFTELARAAAAALGDGSHVLLVVGASAGTGASVVAANLAAAMARIRGEVILVCADQHGSISPRLLGIGPRDGRGLAELIAGRAAVSEVAQPSPAIARLRVIVPGADPSAVDEVQYDAGRRAVMALKEGARYVVIDAGPVTAGGALGLAEFADGSIVVAELDGTTRGEVADCVRRLDRIRTEVLGAAVLPAGRWTDRVARADRRPAGAGQAARPARNDHTETHVGGGGKRRAGVAPQPPAARSDQRPAPAGPGGEAYGPGPILGEYSRRARPDPPGEGTTASGPRAAGQTWPLPGIPDETQGARPGTNYPADYPIAKGTGDG